MSPGCRRLDAADEAEVELGAVICTLPEAHASAWS